MNEYILLEQQEERENVHQNLHTTILPEKVAINCGTLLFKKPPYNHSGTFCGGEQTIIFLLEFILLDSSLIAGKLRCSCSLERQQL